MYSKDYFIVHMSLQGIQRRQSHDYDPVPFVDHVPASRQERSEIWSLFFAGGLRLRCFSCDGEYKVNGIVLRIQDD